MYYLLLFPNTEQAKKQHTKLVNELDAKEEAELEKIENEKTALEVQRNEYSQLCEWVDISTEAAQGVNLMAEIKGGLYDHMQKLSQSNMGQPIKVQFPCVKVNSTQQVMTNMAGTVTYRSTRMAGKNGGQDSYLHIFQKKLNQNTTISVQPSTTRMDIINGDIWIPIPQNSSIQVVDKQGTVVKTLHVHHSQDDTTQNIQKQSRKYKANYYNKDEDRLEPYSVAQAYNGDIIVASNSGLLIIDEQGKVLTTLVQGTFKDVSIDEDEMVALTTGQSRHISITWFKLTQKYWQPMGVAKQEFRLKPMNSGLHNLTIACYCGIIYSTEPGVNYIVQENLDEETINRHGSQYLQNGCNYICGPDKAGNILIAINYPQPLQPGPSVIGGRHFGGAQVHEQYGEYNEYGEFSYGFKQTAAVELEKCRFTILQENGEFINTDTEIPGHVFDAVCDDDGNMWILHRVDGNNRITKYN